MRTKPCVDYKGNHFDSFKEMAEAYGMPVPQLKVRLTLGWDLKTALTTPFRKCKSHKYHNEYIDHLGNKYKTLKSMLETYNTNIQLYTWRRRHGWSIMRALTTPALMRGVKCNKK